MEFTFTIISSIYFLFVGLLKRHDQIKFVNKMQKIDDIMKFDFKINIDYARYKWVSLGILIIVLLYYNVCVGGVMFFILLKDYFQKIESLMTFIVYIVQSSSSGIFTYGYVGYVILINRRVSRINKKLSDIVRFPPEVLEGRYKSKEALCTEMMQFTKIYKNFCSCVEDLNEIFGFSMVLHFAHDFTLLTTQIFAIFYIGFFDFWEPSKYKICALIIWTLPNVLKMSFICLVCHLTRNEVFSICERDASPIDCKLVFFFFLFLDRSLQFTFASFQ